jgi:hypothetical protein
VLAAANTSRISLTGQNIDATEDMWINEIGGTATANTVRLCCPAEGDIFDRHQPRHFNRGRHDRPQVHCH